MAGENLSLLPSATATQAFTTVELVDLVFRIGSAPTLQALLEGAGAGAAFALDEIKNSVKATILELEEMLAPRDEEAARLEQEALVKEENAIVVSENGPHKWVLCIFLRIL